MRIGSCPSIIPLVIGGTGFGGLGLGGGVLERGAFRDSHRHQPGTVDAHRRAAEAVRLDVVHRNAGRRRQVAALDLAPGVADPVVAAPGSLALGRTLLLRSMFLRGACSLRGRSLPGAIAVSDTRRRCLSTSTTHTLSTSPTPTTSCGSRMKRSARRLI